MKKILLLWGLYCIAVCQVLACGPFERYYLAQHYQMFRLCGDDRQGQQTRLMLDNDQQEKENLEGWMQLTSNRIPMTDIRQVVYQWDLQQMQALLEAARGKRTDYPKQNRWARWIVKHRDTEIAEFLLLAKQCEKVRAQLNDPWYYAVEEDDVSQQLDRIIENARAYTGNRLKERYTLQLVRALFASHRYNDCLNVWQQNKDCFQSNILRQMTLGYVAGAHFHIGEKEKALPLFLACGNLYDAYRCRPQRDTLLYEWIYQNHPQSEALLRKLQHDIFQIEIHEENRWEDLPTDNAPRYQKVNDFIQRVLHEGKCTDQAPWLYAAAFVADKQGRRLEARKYLDRALEAPATEDLKNSIRVLDFYLIVKYADRYTPALEKNVLDELQWLDQMIVTHLDDSTRTIIQKEGMDNHIIGLSQYYWNDMLRKIVIGELVPLCRKSGQITRALQYLNLADHRILEAVGSVTLTNRWDATLGKELPNLTLSLQDFRMSGITNPYDYRNDFFLNLDSTDVTYLEQLVEHIQHPSDEVDRFLKPRSYTDLQYLYDLIGTRRILQMQYAQAIPYLKKVSKTFNRSRNVFPYCRIDPFSGQRLKEPDPFYKLHFAQQMVDLEKQAFRAKDPNDKAEHLLRYAQGILRSIDETCWPLTRYYSGQFYCYPMYSSYQRKRWEAAAERIEALKQKAFSLFTDDERASQAYYNWAMYETAATRYRQTKTARFLRGECDKLVDYQLCPTLPDRWKTVQPEDWSSSDFELIHE